MTFFATANERDRIDVHCTYGPVTIKVDEDPGHLRAFWGELGRLLEQVEAGNA